MMAVFRVNKNKDYVTMSKFHFREKNMSLKAIGMLSLMLSLPDDWDYSVEGITSIRSEAKNTINSILNELEEFGYLKRERKYVNGKITNWEYNIYEKPLYLKNQDIENQDIENCTQLNNKELSNKKLNNKKKIIKEKYGEYHNVLLTKEEYERLHKDYSNADELIKFLDEYIEEKGYKSKSHNLSIRRWVVDAVREKKKDPKKDIKRPEWFDKEFKKEEPKIKATEEELRYVGAIK